MIATIWQLEDKRYEAELHNNGVHEVVKLAINFYGQEGEGCQEYASRWVWKV